MDRTTLVRTGIAGAVAGLGLTVGGIAMASADDAPDTSSTSAHPGGPRGERGGYDAAALAKALGLKEATVKTALDAVRDELRPDKPSTTDGTKPTPPTEAERTARQAKFVAALAKKLDVSEAKVKAAIAAQEKTAQAARRADLVTKLDAAVKAGTLTEADKTSVLKAFDAKIIGGGPGGGGFGGGGRGGPPPAASAS